jgi:hypothetical protein
LCVIPAIVAIVKSEESTFIVATCRDKTRDNNVTARVHKITVLSKEQPTLKSQILKQAIIKSMVGPTLLTFKNHR